MSYFSSLFGSSPIRPLQQHMEKVLVCVEQLEPFFVAVLGENWDDAERLQHRISVLEHEADTLKKELRLHLPKGLLMPVARRDVLEVLTMQDQVANKAKDIAGRVLGRRMVFPEPIAGLFPGFLARCIDACRQAQKAINELDELLETGFRGHEVDLVQSLLRELDAIESDTDAREVEIRHRLYEVEKQLAPVDVMFLYQVIEWVGDLADLAQRVGSRLQLMLAQ